MKNVVLELNVQEVNLVLEALGALPFVRVYSLIGRVQEQAQRQVESQQGGDAAERAPANASREPGRAA